MGCLSLTTSFGYSCISGAIGLKAVSFVPWSEDTILSFTNGSVATIPAAITEVYRYKLKATGNTYVESAPLDTETRTRTQNGVLSLVLQGIDLLKRNEIKMLGMGELLIFVEDNNGQVFVVGNEKGAVVADAVATIGTGYALTINSSETEPVLLLSPAAITTYKTLWADEASV